MKLRNLLVYASIPFIVVLFISAMITPPKGLVPTTLNDFFLAGSQPLESGTFKSTSNCGCHGGYDQAVEPMFNWEGSMMSQSLRDPLFRACMTIANQDAPESGDLCIRCHTPQGWLEGRSVPTDGSELIASDREGIHCHFCHKAIKPTPLGVNPYPDEPDYTSTTYPVDQNYLATILEIPPASANGMYVVDDADNRRGPYTDAVANHSFHYSPFHKEAAICGTCHDVSNPVYDTVMDGLGNIIGYTPNTFDDTTENFSPYAQFPIERTYSEWLMSDYNTPAGITGTWFGGNKPYVSTCQDCHMKDVTGKGCNKNQAPVRDDLPLHDMTGGNTFIPLIIDSVYPGEANITALQAGIARATEMLQHAATVELTVDQMDKTASVKVINETGHKLPSGYPEGRRIWINVKAFNSLTSESWESGHYNFATGDLNTTDAKVYEIQPGLSPALAFAIGLTPGKSFHFVVNDTIYLDNRIPPRGFTNANFEAIQSPPVGYSYPDGQYWDVTDYTIPFYPDSVDVTLYYQTLSKEYVTFLRDENVTDSWGDTLYNLWNNNGKSAPVAMNNVTWSGSPVQFTTLDLKVLLEGPYNGTNLGTSLNTNGVIPLAQPYSASPWNYTGTEAVAEIPNVSVVDWVLIELRETPGDASTATSATVIGRQAGFLLSDGSVVGTDGSTDLNFSLVVTENLYVVVMHRNHLPVMSASALQSTGGVYTYDFTTAASQAYGNGHKEIGSGVWGMIGGDGLSDSQINNGDKNDVWAVQAGTGGYLAGDFNMDAQANNGDKNDIWVPNSGLGGQVPDLVTGWDFHYRVID